jgi:cation diffusion facilitator CzcD-associated flavoprotein CzcO
MESWRVQMPKGMLLKSEGFASNLWDPESRFTLEHFCGEMGLTYAETGIPIPRETMAAYGCWFQEHLVPDLEERSVASVDHSSQGFVLQLDSGQEIIAGRVIVAVGHSYFSYVPPPIAQLPSEFVSHSSAHHDLTRFKGTDVTVVGGGASALDLAALLHEVGAEVRTVVRKPFVTFNPKPEPRSLWQRVRHPRSGLGNGWTLLFFSDTPMLFSCCPRQTRLRLVKNHLGAAGGWFLKERIMAKVPLLLACVITKAEIRDGRVHLQLTYETGIETEISTSHVIAATGYKVDIQRIPFLSEKVRSCVQTLESAPVLSRDFESSLPGLYFAGLASATTFGPSMRFMFGARYTAHRLSERLAGLRKY